MFILVIRESEYHFWHLRPILRLGRVYGHFWLTSENGPIWCLDDPPLIPLLWGVNHVTWCKLELGRWNLAIPPHFPRWFQKWQPLSCRMKMKGRYGESCRITLHEENFFMREEMTMAYTFSRLIFYAEFKNDNLFDVRSKSRECLVAYKMHTFWKWPKSWP